MNNSSGVNSSPRINAQHNKDIINLRELLFKYLRNWYWFALSVILAFLVATIYLKKTEIKYQVKTTLLLRNEDQAGALPQLTMMENFGLSGANKEVEDEIQVLSSQKLLKEVIDTLKIHAKYFEKDKLKYVEKYNDVPFRLNNERQLADTMKRSVKFIVKEEDGKFFVKIKIGKVYTGKFELNSIQETMDTPFGKFSFTQVSKPKKDSKFKITLQPIAEVIDEYSNKIKVATVNKQSNAIQISIVESNIEKAKDMLNNLVMLYNLDANSDKNIIATNTSNFINERLAIITDELFDVESNVENYKRAHSLTDLSSEAELYLKSADEYENKLTEYVIQLNMIKAVEAYVNNPKNEHNLIPTNIVTDDKSLPMAIQAYNTSVLDRMKLAKTAKEDNPVLILADEQIQALRSNVLASVSSVKSGLQIALNDLKRKDSQFSSKIKNVPTQERQFLEIKRQQEIKQSLYLLLFQKKEETAIKLASTAPAARTIDRAFASLLPVSPKRSVTYMLALIIGLLVPFVLIYVKDLINNKIEDTKEFQRLIKAPYLGNISTSRESDKVVVREGRTAPIVEMFRLVRTNLQFLIAGKKSPVILVTSTLGGEGKSFTSINLAMSFALMKKRVVLVGLDVRKPMLGEYLNLNKQIGATLFLSDKSYELKDIIQNSGLHQYLDVIPAGPIPPNPSELLMSNRLEEMFELLKDVYDYIIVDTAPIGVVSDTYLLNRIADNAIYVSRQDYTPKDATILINEIAAEKRLNGLGVILNGTPASTGYGYSYGYGNKYTSSHAPRITLGEKVYDFFKKNK